MHAQPIQNANKSALIPIRLSPALQGETDLDTKWFRARLEEAQITQRHLAKTLGVDPAAVSYLLRGRRRMQLDEAAEIARLIGASIEEVMLHAGIEPPRGSGTINGAEVAITGIVDPASGEISDHRSHKKRRAFVPTQVTKGAVALCIEGKGAPEDGWTLFYVPRDQVEAGAVGSLAVVTLPGKRGQYVRVVEKGGESGTFNLRAWPRGRDLENARILAANPVILIKP